MELFQKEGKSATDLRDIVFLLKYTKDTTATFDTIENMSAEEFQATLSTIGDEK